MNLMVNDLNKFSMLTGEGIKIAGEGYVYLRVNVQDDRANYYYSPDEETWIPVGAMWNTVNSPMNISKERGIERFTGAFVGMCCRTLPANIAMRILTTFTIQRTTANRFGQTP